MVPSHVMTESMRPGPAAASESPAAWALILSLVPRAGFKFKLLEGQYTELSVIESRAGWNPSVMNGGH